MCRRDWYQVPKRLRDEVWRSWRSGQEANSHEHQRAVFQAIAAAHLAQLPGWRRQFARLRLLRKAESRPWTALKETGKFTAWGLDACQRFTKVLQAFCSRHADAAASTWDSRARRSAFRPFQARLSAFFFLMKQLRETLGVFIQPGGRVFVLAGYTYLLAR
jgi:hypothetical protein